MRSGSHKNEAGRTLSATSRFRVTSRALYTSPPIPPCPSRERISKWPILSPMESGMGAVQLSVANRRLGKDGARHVK